MRDARRVFIVLGTTAVVMAVVVAVVAAALWAVALVTRVASDPIGLIDLQVYRTGGEAWLRGVPLYGPEFPTAVHGPPLPFTYPPVAAVLFAALAVLPWALAIVLVTGTGVAGLAVACWVAADRLAERNGWLTSGRAPVALLAVATASAALLVEPVRHTVSFGQINLLLMGAIAADCMLRRTPWPRGTLIGIAAAVKLTPAAFVLFFLARRQWRPVLAAVASFVAAGLLGLVFAPGDTRAYWFGALLDPTRVGHVEFVSNQSLRGLLYRLGLPDGLQHVAWLALSAAVGLLAMYGVSHLRQRGDDVAALVVTAAAVLLVSPVSWSHHWVWVVLGLLWLAEYAGRTRSPAGVVVAIGVLAVFASAPFWRLPYRNGQELEWSASQQLLGNAYVWVALATVVIAAVLAVVAARRGAGRPRLVPAPVGARPG